MKPFLLRKPIVALVVLAAVFQSACAAPPRTAPTAPRPATTGARIELAHQLGADGGAQLEALIERYNASNPPMRVELSTRDWHSGATPELLILKEDDEARFLASKPGPKPLHQVMKDAGEPLDTFRPPPTLSPHPLDDQNRLIALPISLGTPVTYFNKDMLRRAGVDTDTLPPTWQGLQDVLGKLYDKGMHCPYTTSNPVWVHLENTSAWHNEPVVGGNGALSANGLLQVKHLAMMSSWYKSRYLHIFGRNDEAEARFLSGECAVLTAGSERFPAFLRRASFGVGVAALPYHEDYRGAPQNTLADGPALWVANGKSAAQYKAVAHFVRFLLSPESQVEMQRRLGGLPLNRAGALAARGELLKTDLASVRIAIDTLTNKPATDISRASRTLQRAEVRRLLNDALEQVWANKKPAKQALDDAVARARKGALATAQN